MITRMLFLQQQLHSHIKVNGISSSKQVSQELLEKKGFYLGLHLHGPGTKLYLGHCIPELPHPQLTLFIQPCGCQVPGVK